MLFKKVKKVIQKRLKEQFDAEKAEEIWEKIQFKYVEYLKKQPYLWGRKNGHNAAGGTYDCFALFAYYEVMERKPGIQEIYDMDNEVLLPAMELLHAGLIREKTCANSDVCDYWIVGDKSRYLKEYPKQTNSQGYVYNKKEQE